MPRPFDAIQTFQSVQAGNANGTVVDCGGYSAYLLEVTGSGAYVVNFEVALEHSDDTQTAVFVSVLAQRRSDGLKGTTTTGNNEQWLVPTSGCGQVRARTSGNSGSVTVIGRPLGDEFVSADIGQLDVEASAISIGTVTQGTAAATSAAWPASDVRNDDNNGATTLVVSKADFRYRVVSATNTQQQVVLDTLNMHDTLSIHMAASAGTSAVTVEASADNSNWIQADSIAAAQFTIKVYGPTTAGAAAGAAGAGPIAPLSYRYVRITAATAGVGNTTTLTIGAK